LFENFRGGLQGLLHLPTRLTDNDLNMEGISGLPPDERFWKAIASATWWSYPRLSAPIRPLLQRTT
jgi:hypothetical protein